ncbi:unnamed protein product [Malus baccata var. baccata]
MTNDMYKSKKDQRKFSKLMKLPISITKCSGQFDCNAMMGCPSAQIPSALPRSLSASSTISTASSDEDFRELERAASARTRGSTNLGLVAGKTQQPRLSPKAGTGSNVMARSQSVRIGRIDEDKPCEFDEEEMINVKGDV